MRPPKDLSTPSGLYIMQIKIISDVSLLDYTHIRLKRAVELPLLNLLDSLPHGAGCSPQFAERAKEFAHSPSVMRVCEGTA